MSTPPARRGSSSGPQAHGQAYRLTGRFQEATEVFKKYRDVNPENSFPNAHFAITYAQWGRDADARASLAEALKINPAFSLQAVPGLLAYRDPADLERDLDALRKAGLK